MSATLKQMESIYCRTPGCQHRLGTRTTSAVLIRGVRSPGLVSAQCPGCKKWHDYRPLGTDEDTPGLVG